MSLVIEAKKLLSENDSQTAIGKFAQSVIDCFEPTISEDPYQHEGEYTLTKVSKNLGATEVDFSYEGTFVHIPVFGKQFYFFYDTHVISTSLVQEVTILDKFTVEIKTINSTYILQKVV